MTEEKTITTTLRIPKEKNVYLRQKADEIGVSQNSLILMLLDIGIRAYELLSYSPSEEASSDMRRLIR